MRPRVATPFPPFETVAYSRFRRASQTGTLSSLSSLDGCSEAPAACVIEREGREVRKTELHLFLLLHPGSRVSPTHQYIHR